MTILNSNIIQVQAKTLKCMHLTGFVNYDQRMIKFCA